MNDMAKLFWTGRSQAVRLPKQFRFDGEAVRIWRDGKRVVLEPAEPDGWDWLKDIRPLDRDAAAAALDRPGSETLPEGPSFD